MPLHERVEDADGNVTISIQRAEKVIRASDGTLQLMVSFDGETWVLEKNQQKEKLRLSRAANLHGSQWIEARKAELQSRIDPGNPKTPDPEILPVTHHGQRIVKKRGKQQKYRRNLRKKHERNVLISQPVHFHRCHGTKYSCSCETPWKSRRCGGKYCLQATMAEEMMKGAR